MFDCEFLWCCPKEPKRELPPTVKTLEESGFDFGMNLYPIFDESYREILNKLILDTYYYYRICSTYPEKFHHYLNNALDLIMPAYNLLFLNSLEREGINPYNTTDYKETYERSGSENTEGQGTGSSDTDNKNCVSEISQNEGHSEGTGNDTNTRTDNLSAKTTNKQTVKNTGTENTLNIATDTPSGFLQNANDPKYASTAYTNTVTPNTTQTTDGSGSTDNTGTQQNKGDRSTTEESKTIQGRQAIDKLESRNKTTSTNTVNNNSTEEYLRTIIGYQGKDVIGAYQTLYTSLKSIEQRLVYDPEISKCFMNYISA